MTCLGVARIVRAEHGILPSELGIKQLNDGSILNVDSLKEEQWLRYHVHAGAITINQIEVRKLFWIWNRCNQAVKL